MRMLRKSVIRVLLGAAAAEDAVSERLPTVCLKKVLEGL